jgi:hypothetical protein
MLLPQVLLPLSCSVAPVPLPVGHADESVTQQLHMPSLQQCGACWFPARKEVRRPVKLHCPRPSPAAPLASNLQGSIDSEHVNGIP